MANAKSDWATKINGRSVAKQMPLLSGFSGYSEWGYEAERWTRMLYNHPASLVIAYVIINMKDIGALTGKEASVYAKRKLKSKTDENEGAIKNGGLLRTYRL